MDNKIDLIKAARLLVLKDAYRRHYKKVQEIEQYAKNKIKGIEVIRVFVHDQDWGLYTKEAYQELRLGFSTGDLNSHRIWKECVEDFSEVTTLDDLNEEVSND